jgi:hypothetical protein
MSQGPARVPTGQNLTGRRGQDGIRHSGLTQRAPSGSLSIGGTTGLEARSDMLKPAFVTRPPFRMIDPPHRSRVCESRSSNRGSGVA